MRNWEGVVNGFFKLERTSRVRVNCKRERHISITYHTPESKCGELKSKNGAIRYGRLDLVTNT